MANDPHTAELVAAGVLSVGEDDEQARGPRLTEWTPEVALLSQIVDKLAGLTIATYATSGVKKSELPKFEPAPRPATAVAEAIRQRRRKQKVDTALDLIAMLTPDDLGEFESILRGGRRGI